MHSQGVLDFNLDAGPCFHLCKIKLGISVAVFVGDECVIVRIDRAG